jgi:hypothetical protein
VATLLIEWLDIVDERFPQAESSRYRLTWDFSQQELYIEILGTGDAGADVDRLWSIDSPPLNKRSWSIIPLLRDNEVGNHDISLHDT